MKSQHDKVIRLFSVLQVLLGVAIIVVTVFRGGGPLSLGVILGVALVAVGLARWRLQQRMGAGG